MDLTQIQKDEAEDSSHFFPDTDHSLVYLGCALAGEVGEACNVIKKGYRGSIPDTSVRELLKDELPDILIYLVMLADAMDIDLEKAYVIKKRYNRGRYTKTSG